MDESELLDLPEDEYDELNDETFGDTGEEYNWEQNHELFGTLIDNNLSNGAEARVGNNIQVDEQGHQHRNVGDRQRSGDTFEAPLGDPEQYEFENENALEESISRLVLDEYDEDDNVASERLRRMANTSSYAYFMPPQVVNRHLQWFMDKEFSGDSSLLGSSVWSMHPTTVGSSSANAAHENVSAQPSVPISSVQNASQVPTAKEQEARNDRDSIRALVPGAAAGPDLTMLLNSARAQENLGGLTAAGASAKPPTFKTVDEIEQEMMRESEILRNKLEGAHEKAVAQKTRPKIISVEDLEREFIQDSPVQASTPSNVRPGTHGGVPPTVKPESQLVPELPKMDARVPHPNMMVPPHGQVPLAASIANNVAFMRHAMVQRPQPRNVPFPHPNNFPHGMPGMGPQPLPIHPLHLHQQQQIRFLQQQMNASQMRAAFRPTFPMHPSQRWPNKDPYGKGFMMNPFPNFMIPPRPMPPAHMARGYVEARDGGLMTEKDKQRLKNIQIVQLQNDHPHTTDYYCLMRKVRIGSKGYSPLDLLRLLFPKKNDDENARKSYEPAHFENSLGKLQAQSALAPKKAIDTVIRVVDAGPVGGKKKCYRYLLLEIEKVYECLLTLEEADLRTVVSTNNKNNSAEENEIRLVKSKVERLLTDKSKIAALMSVKKGKFLVCRLAALMDNNIRMVALFHLITSFPTWAISGPIHTSEGKHELIELYPYLKHCVLNMDTDSIELLCHSLSKELIASLLSIKLGSSILMVLLHQGEQLTCNMQLTDQLKRLWCQLGVVPAVTILLQNQATVVPPAEIFQIGFQRLLACEFLSDTAKVELKVVLESFLSKGTKVIKS